MTKVVNQSQQIQYSLPSAVLQPVDPRDHVHELLNAAIEEQDFGEGAGLIGHYLIHNGYPGIICRPLILPHLLPGASLDPAELPTLAIAIEDLMTEIKPKEVTPDVLNHLLKYLSVHVRSLLTTADWAELELNRLRHVASLYREFFILEREAPGLGDKLAVSLLGQFGELFSRSIDLLEDEYPGPVLANAIGEFFAAISVNPSSELTDQVRLTLERIASLEVAEEFAVNEEDLWDRANDSEEAEDEEWVAEFNQELAQQEAEEIDNLEESFEELHAGDPYEIGDASELIEDPDDNQWYEYEIDWEETYCQGLITLRKCQGNNQDADFWLAAFHNQDATSLTAHCGLDGIIVSGEQVFKDFLGSFLQESLQDEYFLVHLLNIICADERLAGELTYNVVETLKEAMHSLATDRCEQIIFRAKELIYSTPDLFDASRDPENLLNCFAASIGISTQKAVVDSSRSAKA